MEDRQLDTAGRRKMTTNGEQAAAMVKHGVDIIGAGAILGTFLGALPPLAALAAILWYAVQIWESDTIQGWVKGNEAVRHRHRQRQLAHAARLRDRLAAKALQVQQAATALTVAADQAAVAATVHEEPLRLLPPGPPQGVPPFGNE